MIEVGVVIAWSYFDGMWNFKTHRNSWSSCQTQNDKLTVRSFPKADYSYFRGFEVALIEKLAKQHAREFLVRFPLDQAGRLGLWWEF